MNEEKVNYSADAETVEEMKQAAEMPKMTGRMKRNWYKSMGVFKTMRDLGFNHPDAVEFRKTRREEGREMHTKNVAEQKEKLEAQLQARKAAIIESMQKRDYYTDQQISDYVEAWEDEQRQGYWHS